MEFLVALVEDAALGRSLFQLFLSLSIVFNFLVMNCAVVGCELDDGVYHLTEQFGIEVEVERHVVNPRVVAM